MLLNKIDREATRVARKAGTIMESMSETEQLAHWMIENSFATGHGDSFADLLKELTWQVAELRKGQTDKLRELIMKWREIGDQARNKILGMVFNGCADDLERSLMPAAPAPKFLTCLSCGLPEPSCKCHPNPANENSAMGQAAAPAEKE
jgi:hypothetical protein